VAYIVLVLIFVAASLLLLIFGPPFPVSDELLMFTRIFAVVLMLSFLFGVIAYAPEVLTVASRYSKFKTCAKLIYGGSLNADKCEPVTVKVSSNGASVTSGVAGNMPLGAYSARKDGLVAVGCRVAGGPCDGLIVAIADPERACLIRGTLDVRLGGDSALAVIYPVAPGVAKVRLHCSVNGGRAKLYIGDTLVAECKNSDTVEATVDFRGFNEPIAVIIKDEVDLDGIMRMLRAPVAGLCFDAPQAILTIERGGKKIAEGKEKLEVMPAPGSNN